jgi:AcrR family transcriptional regulator
VYVIYLLLVGRPANTDRARILAEALALADERGLEAVTMAAVAERVGVTTMALYRHVANKADLLDGLVETLLAEAVPPTPQLPWLERLSSFAHELRATAHRHPSAFILLVQRPAATAQARQQRDAINDALNEAGIRPEQIDQMQRLLSTAVLGFALSEVTGRFDALTTAQRDADFELLLELLGESIRSQLSA